MTQEWDQLSDEAKAALQALAGLGDLMAHEWREAKRIVEQCSSPYHGGMMEGYAGATRAIDKANKTLRTRYGL